MPTPTIPAGNLYMNATTYTGTGAALTVTNGVAGAAFQPDMVWLKCRSNATNHYLTDSVRGTTKQIYSNSTAAEGTSGNILTAFNSNGFSLGTDAEINGSGRTNVAWNFKAGGTAVSNTSGTITSSVSANTTSGFSVVTFTGNGTNNATVGHGLGATPALIILKSRTQTYNWDIYSQSLGLTATLIFTSAATRNVNAFGTNNPTSSVFSVYTNYTNDSGQNYVAYCWAPIAGYSAFGSYTGNGSADGPFVYLGFRPRFIMWKRSDSTGDWTIFDTSRNTYNYADLQLNPNTSGAEQVTGGGFERIDFLSNGFKIRSTDSYINASGGTYIYACFAENPFKYANAR